MPSIIAPSITVETEDQYRSSIDRIKPFVERAHIDISDGVFSPVFLVEPEKLWWPREWTVDIHAMVMQPNEYLSRLVALRPNLIIFHAETGTDLVPVIAEVKRNGIKAGIALLRPTVPATITEAIKAADHVLIFSGDLGHYGGTANLMQLEKIRLIRSINPNIEVGWDGGVNIDNAFILSQGGANVLNVGGAIANAEDPTKAYYSLVDETNKQGVI
jgi:ribulose-phosphate 3-epimerase